MNTKLPPKVLIALLFLQLAFTTIRAQDMTYLTVTPPTADIFVGETFSVNITAVNVTDLHGVNITLQYNPNFLDAIQCQLLDPWPSNNTGVYQGNGYVWINSTLTTPEGISGTVIISEITFQGVGEGSSFLTIAEGDLLNSTDGQLSYIPKSAYVVVTLFKIRVPYDYPTIQQAINAADTGDTIFVYHGVYNEQITLNKTVALLAENLDTIIDAGNSEVAVNITASAVKLQGFMVRNGTIGINILSSGNTIQGNVATADGTGMRIIGGTGSIIVNNTFTECTNGTSFIQSTYNHMIGNRVGENSVGIYIKDSLYTTIENIRVINNTNGIAIENSQNGKIARNKILLNQNGMILTNSTDNWILRNNFDNAVQLTMQNSTGNTWDNGVEGNFWSDYMGNDLNGDGIGDTNLPHQGLDNYPLINPYFSGDVNHDQIVDSVDLGFLGWAWGTLSGEPGWDATCDLNEDGSVDSSDLGWMGTNWGKGA